MANNKARKTSPSKRGAKQSPTFFGWLGRQVGHVKNAVQTDVTKPAKPASSPRTSARKPARAATGAAPTPPAKVIYRDDKVEEIEHPNQPGVKLRRTIIDEVIVEADAPSGPIDDEAGKDQGSSPAAARR